MIDRKKNSCSRLRQRLTLQEELRTPDGSGGYTRSWKDIASLWAEIVPIFPLSNRELPFAGQLQSKVTHKILLRYRGDVTTSHRLVFEKRVFNIRYAANAREDNETLELWVEEGVGG